MPGGRSWVFGRREGLGECEGGRRDAHQTARMASEGPVSALASPAACCCGRLVSAGFAADGAGSVRLRAPMVFTAAARCVAMPTDVRMPAVRAQLSARGK